MPDVLEKDLIAALEKAKKNSRGLIDGKYKRSGSEFNIEIDYGLGNPITDKIWKYKFQKEIQKWDKDAKVI